MFVMKPENENEESRGTEGARRATGVAREAAGRNGDNPDPEVADKATRRRFTAAYKRRTDARSRASWGRCYAGRDCIPRACAPGGGNTMPGELAGMGSAKRGRKAQPKDGRDKRIAELEREAQRLQRKLEEAETVIEIQKQVSTLLGIPLKNPDQEENN